LSKLLCLNNEDRVDRSKDTYTADAYTLVGNHPLHIIAKCEEMRLMEHDYCMRLGTEKFQRFAAFLFSIFFLIYVLFVILYTLIVLRSKHPYYYYSLFNESSKDRDVFKSSTYQLAAPILYLLSSISIGRNLIIILFGFPRIFRKMSIYFESLSVILCFINIYDWYAWRRLLDIRCPIQWQLVSDMYYVGSAKK
jgi:hypothetical protein